MRFNGKSIVLIGLIVGTTIGAECIPTVNDDAKITVNVNNVQGHYNITTGATVFGNPNQCTTVSAAQYLDSDYGTVVGGRIVDITYKANGTYGGNVQNGTVTVNGVLLLSYTGTWTALTTSQSLLSPGSTIVKNAAGETRLTTAVQNNENITLCVTGTFSSAVPAGLSVDVTVNAQVDVLPN